MANDQRHVVMFSGGAASFVAGRRIEAHGIKPTWLFCDTLIEDDDLYRFVDDVAKGRDFVRIADGRTPWQVFRDVRFLGNTRADPCSRILKRKLARKWVDENAPAAAIVCGISWDEAHRLDGMRKNWAPYDVLAPLCDKPFLFKVEIVNQITEAGLTPSASYDLGFSHDNCGGFCIKAGQGHFAHLLRERPKVYAQHEAEEQGFREFIGKDVAILRDRRGGETRPMTLREFRERIERDEPVDLFEWGGCGCFA